MSKTFVGARAQNMDIGAEVAAITRVNLVVDSDHMYTVGNATGRTIEVECPWGTEKMASDILAKVSGVNYKPFSAEKALLDPAFEIGDAVTIGGVYSQIAGADCTYNGASLFNIEAPDLDEIDDEYPAQQTQQSSIKRQLAYTRSLISKTSEQILLKVEGTDGKGGLAGKVAELSVTIDGVTVTTTNADGTKTITLKDGIVTADAIATGVIPTSTKDLTNDSGWTDYTGVVTIIGATVNADYIEARSVTAKKLMGGEVGLLASPNNQIGAITITETSTGDGIKIETDNQKGGIRIEANGGNVYIKSGGGQFLQLGQGSLCQIGGGPFVVDANSYGTGLPGNGTYGQVFFLLES